MSFDIDLSPEDISAAAAEWWTLRIAEARNDVNSFMSLCFRNDQDPLAPPFEQQWFHIEWQAMWLNDRMTVIHGATGFGKTDQLIGHIIWRMGRQPNIRIAIICKTSTKAKERLFKIKEQIENNEMIRAVFPDLVPGEKWNFECLRVAGAGIDTTTNTVTPFGVDGDIMGGRFDLMFLDDVTDDENSATDEMRKKIINRCDRSFQSRLTTRGQLHIIANAWHKEDLPHVYAKRPGITYKSYPAHDGNMSSDLNHVTFLWPAFRGRRWFVEAVRTMTPTAAARMFLCQARDDATRVFQKEWFDTAKERGRGVMPVRTVKQYDDVVDARALIASGLSFAARHRMRVVIGVDLATGKKQKKRKSDLTVFYVLGVWPDGDRQLLWIESGRWPGVESLRRLRELQERYHPDRFEIEDNGAQEFFVNFAIHFPGVEVRVEGFTTTGAKWDEALGIEGIGVEMASRRWIIPSPALGESEEHFMSRLGPEREPDETHETYAARLKALNPEYREAYVKIQQFCQNLLEFSRDVHTPDDVMAAYFAREAVLRMTNGVFQPLDPNGREPHPASPLAEAERDRAALGNAANFNPPQPPPAAPLVTQPPYASAAAALLPFGMSHETS